MILNQYVLITGNSKNLQHYRKKGYSINVGDNIEVKVEDLSIGSTFKVDVSCDICGNIKNMGWGTYLKHKNKDPDNKYYCSKCSCEKRFKTNELKYGGKSPTKSKTIVDKIKKTNMQRYGNNSSLHGNRQKITENIFIEKYGNKTPLLNEDIQNKIKNTLVNRYNVEHPLRSDIIIKKLKETNLKKWGTYNVSKSKEIIDKIKKINREEYGFDWYYQSDDFKKKRKETIKNKYGVDNYFKSSHRKEYVLNSKLENYPDLKIVDYENGIFEIECVKCNGIYNIKTDLLYKRYKEGREVCTKCNKLYNKFRSNAEIEICEFLKCNNIEFKTSVRDIIKGEIDIYIPSKKIAIEYNGIFWHSEFFKNRKYHYNKYISCKKNGVKLIQIWEDTWNEDKNKVKSFLLNKINIYKKRIFARSCHIKNIEPKIKDVFLNENHLQKSSRSSINIGLYYDEELVSIMTFGKRRINSKETFELIRYCTKKDYIIVGGASKLFNYFKKNYKFEQIVSYSDNSYSNGEIYNILGFENTNETINYYWTNSKKRYHRFNFNKKRLVKMGHDKNKTEYEIMRESGYYKIFGSGVKTWIYKKN